ncbi:WhiB family transcriptional regulator [Nocardia rhizosphaerihabitans]|uniref:WhiB family transcriptional regulator n=1 Tax=Nocardia rhizosphaerihabitans TaxID=1691570 RepID=UPI0036712D02
MQAEWRQRAACQYVYPDVFFPPRVHRARYVTAARRICGDCVVVRECASFALANNVTQGIFARVDMGSGMTPRRGALALLRDLSENESLSNRGGSPGGDTRSRARDCEPTGRGAD